jgi:hypothetical protein
MIQRPGDTEPVGERTTAPWPAIGSGRPKPRLIVALRELPPPVEADRLDRELRAQFPRARLQPLPVPHPSIRAQIRMGAHVTDVHGHPSRFDIEEILPLTGWSEQEKARLASHEAYVMCTPKTSAANAYEQYLTLYRIAAAYGALGGLCGVVNPLASSFTPPVAVQNILSEEMIAQCRVRLPPQLFTSYARYFGTGGTWCATKGQEVFGVPNFAYFVPSQEVEWAFEHMWRLFLYGYEEGGVYAPGDRVAFAPDLGPHVLRRVSEVARGWEPYLETPGGTLVITSTAGALVAGA